MAEKAAADYSDLIRQFAVSLATEQTEQLVEELEVLRESLAKRPVYIMFEQELECDPLTDHEIPKSVLPLFEKVFSEEEVKSKRGKAGAIETEVQLFCEQLAEQEVALRVDLELENQREGGEIAQLNGLLAIHEKNLSKLELQVNRLSKSLEQLTFTAKEEAHEKGVIGKMYQADGDKNRSETAADADGQEPVLGVRNIADLEQRYVSSEQALESSKLSANKLLEEVRILQEQVAEAKDAKHQISVLESEKDAFYEELKQSEEALESVMAELSGKEEEIERLKLVQDQLSSMVNEANALNPDKIRKEIEEGVRDEFAAEVRAMRETIVKQEKENTELETEKKNLENGLDKANEQIEDEIAEINEVDRDLERVNAELRAEEQELQDVQQKNVELELKVSSSNQEIVNLNAEVLEASNAGDKAAHNTITSLEKEILILNQQNADLETKLKTKERDLKELESKSARGIRVSTQASSKGQSPDRNTELEFAPSQEVITEVSESVRYVNEEILHTDKSVETDHFVTPPEIQVKRKSEFDIHCYDIVSTAPVKFHTQVDEISPDSMRMSVLTSEPSTNQELQYEDEFPPMHPFLEVEESESCNEAEPAENLEIEDVEAIEQPKEEFDSVLQVESDYDAVEEENSRLKSVICEETEDIAELQRELEEMEEVVATYQNNVTVAEEIPHDTRVQQYVEFESSLKADLKMNENYLETQLTALKEAEETVFTLESNLNIPQQQRQDLQERVTKIQHNLPFIEGLVTAGGDNARTAFVLESVTESSAIENRLHEIEEAVIDPEGKRSLNKQLQKESAIKRKPTRSNLTELSMISTTHERLFKMASIIQERIEQAREEYNKERETGYRRYLESMRCLSREEMDLVDSERSERLALEEERRNASLSEESAARQIKDAGSMLSLMGRTANEIELSIVDLEPYELLSEPQFVYKPERITDLPPVTIDHRGEQNLPALRITQTAGADRRVLTRVSLFGSDVERLEYLGPQRRLDYLEEHK